MFRRLLTYMLIAAPVLCGADKPVDKTLLEIVREVGNLQDQVKAMQKDLETKLVAFGQSNAEQSRAAGEQTGKSVALLGDRIAKSLQDQQDQQAKTLAAVAAMGSQLQAVVTDLSTMREAMNELTVSLGKFNTKLGDLGTEVKALQIAKPDVPTVRPEISATELYGIAENDRFTGKFDLALNEYTEFVTKFGDSEQAPDAQYNIGSIHYSRSEWDDAVAAFNLLLKNYPTKKTPEALYYKGDALARSGHWPEADTTLKDLRKRFPSHLLAKQSLEIKPGLR